jgi:hypothetical protein
MLIGCPTGIPTVLYPDKYTNAWTEPMREVRGKIEEQTNLLAEIDLKEDQLRRFTRDSSAQQAVQDVFEPQALLQTLVQHFSAEQEAKGLAEDGGSEDVTMESQTEGSPDFLLLLKDVLSQLEEKLHGMAIQFSYPPRRGEISYLTLDRPVGTESPGSGHPKEPSVFLYLPQGPRSFTSPVDQVLVAWALCR